MDANILATFGGGKQKHIYFTQKENFLKNLLYIVFLLKSNILYHISFHLVVLTSKKNGSREAWQGKSEKQREC